MTERRTIDLSEIIERQKLTPFIIVLVALSWIVTFFDGFDMNSMAFVATDLSAALHLDRLTLGKVFGGAQAGMALGGFLFGYLGDRFGRRPAIILATTSFGFLTLAIVLPHSFAPLFALRFVQGIAVGGLLPLAWALNIEYVPRAYRSTVVTLIMLGYALGGSFAGLITVWLTPRYGWRSLFVFGGCAALLATVLLVLLLPESLKFLATRGKRPDLIVRYVSRISPDRVLSASDRFILSDEATGPAKGFRVSLLFRNELRWITPLIWTAYTVSSIAVFFGSQWGPTVLQAIGYSRSTAALAVSANSIGTALGALLLMRFIDRRGAISIAVFPMVVIPVLLTMAFGRIAGFGFLALNFFSFFLIVGAHIGIQSIAGIFYPSAYRANGAGWAASIGKIGSVIGPLIGGVFLSSRLPVKLVFAFLAVCPFIVGIEVFFIGLLQRRISSSSEAHSNAQPLAPLATEIGLPE
jgi:AAHS family 4-hydroxybenzoate transporter-like MFS transporter